MWIESLIDELKNLVNENKVFIIRKAVEEELNNMAFIWGNAGELLNYFAPREIERIHINFCDPWPKARWYKRRLTYKGYLDIYREILCPGGQVFFKTDNEALFEFTLNEFNKVLWGLHDISLDLHSNPSRDIVATEYEMKFLSQGFKIYHLGATKITAKIRI
jgi:tRNA (guanine-N7-)-methyltransferase